MKKNTNLRGFLQICADRRFHAQVEKEFQKTTGLSETDYWLEAKAGGAPGIKDSLTADYAYEHGSNIMGWAAHGSNCGGFPQVSDEEIKKKLEEAVKERQTRYPDAAHFKIFSNEEETVIKKAG